MTHSYVPTPDDKFTFGLWTVGLTGRDPLGEPTHAVLSTPYITQTLGELGAPTYLFWCGREDAELDAGGKLHDAIGWSRDSLNFLADYSQAKAYSCRFALEPRPNEPRGDISFPIAGNTLGFIATLERPDQLTVDRLLGTR